MLKSIIGGLLCAGALSAGTALAAGFPNGKYTFKSLASPNGLYPAGYFTFNVDVSIKNTDATADWVRYCWYQHDCRI